MVILNQILQYAILLFQWSEYNSQSEHLNCLILSSFIYEDWTLKDTGLVKVSILEHFMFFACLYSSYTVLFNVKRQTEKSKKSHKQKWQPNPRHQEKENKWHWLSCT